MTDLEQVALFGHFSLSLSHTQTHTQTQTHSLSFVWVMFNKYDAVQFRLRFSNHNITPPLPYYNGRIVVDGSGVVIYLCLRNASYSDLKLDQIGQFIFGEIIKLNV